MMRPPLQAGFPAARLRRLRRTPGLRALVRETGLTTDDLILPLFVEEGLTERQPIAALPGVFRETEDSLAAAVREAESLGIRAVILFGVSHRKDAEGRDSLRPDGLAARMIARAREAAPDMVIIADACFCEYTDHGHCGPLDARGDVDNDRTLENLALQAVTAAKAGADVIAPSGMMDGMVGTIRGALDAHGFSHVAIMAYSVKYASAFYGPFREAAGCALGSSANGLSDRKTYQMDPANGDEALREAAQDVREGADMLMVKPGLPYLDIIRRIGDEFKLPLCAYHVSGEYAMLKAAAEKGWLDYEACLMETLLSFKRAGCDAILTYAALDAARLINAHSNLAEV